MSGSSGGEDDAEATTNTATGGQQRAQPTAQTDQPSVTAVLQEPAVKQYVRAIAGAMAVVGVGLGAMVVLLGALGGSPSSMGGQTAAQMTSQQYKLGLVNTAIGVAPYVALAVASVAGLLVGVHFDATTRKAVVATAAGALVGTVLLVFLTDVIAVSQAPSVGGQSLSLDYGQVLVNSVLMGVAAAVAGGGGAYFGDELA
jgi:hypothetical protein